MELIKCAFCNDLLPEENGVREHWIPSFAVGNWELDEPVCPECQEKYLNFNREHYDFEVKEESLLRVGWFEFNTFCEFPIAASMRYALEECGGLACVL